MTKKQRYKGIIEYFKKNMPEAKSELNYTNAYQLSVAVLLSAQCTDVRVNKITPDFFKRFPSANELMKAKIPEIFELIKSCSFANNKSKYLQSMAKTLVNEFNNIFPSNVDELQKLQGIGRKSANVIASVIFNKPVMPVDTHVFRVSERIGLTTNAKNPIDTEEELTKNFPEKLIPIAHHWLILHGRYVCKARKPKCDDCGITEFCKFFC